MFHGFNDDSTIFVMDLMMIHQYVSWIQFFLTLWLFNIAMENGPFIDDFPIKTSIYKGFSSSLC